MILHLLRRELLNEHQQRFLGDLIEFDLHSETTRVLTTKEERGGSFPREFLDLILDATTPRWFRWEREEVEHSGT